MIRVLFFASLRERLQCDALELPSEGMSTVQEVFDALLQQSPLFAETLSSPKPLMAVNQEIAHATSPVKAGDEVAFYPPVTGG